MLEKLELQMAASHHANDEDWTWIPASVFVISEPAL